MDRRTAMLFENKPGRFEAAESALSATVQPDKTLALRDMAVLVGDDRGFGHGCIKAAFKRHPNQPDLRGRMRPASDRSSAEGEWEVVGWWRFTRAGKRYIFLVMTAPQHVAA